MTDEIFFYLMTFCGLSNDFKVIDIRSGISRFCFSFYEIIADFSIVFSVAALFLCLIQQQNRLFCNHVNDAIDIIFFLCINF